MFLKTKKPHRVVMKNGVIKTYQPGHTVTADDKELYDAIRFHKLYRRETYMGKLEGMFSGKPQKGSVNKEAQKPEIKIEPEAETSSDENKGE